MKALVLGGNNFFGKKLVRLLLEKKYSVTLLNRGNKKDGFKDKVLRIKCDRNNKKLFSNVIDQKYDFVFDQCCYDYEQAKLSCDVFENKVSKYIFTSSISAYSSYGSSLRESSIDFRNNIIEKMETMNTNYGLAKRQAEIAFFKYASFPVITVRFPIVLDSKDTTERLQFHVNRIRKKIPIYFSNLESKISFISADDAAMTLLKLGHSSLSEPINVATSKPVSLLYFLSLIEKNIGGQFILSNKKTEDNVSPYNISENWYMDCSKLEELEFSIRSINSFLPGMIKSMK